MRKEVKVVRDPDKIKVALEDTRADILSLLKVNEMTISQLVESLDKAHSTIYRHIMKLKEAGYVELAKKKIENNVTKRWYDRTAEAFLLSPKSLEGGDSSNLMMEWERENARKILELLEKMGYSVDEEEEEEVVNTLCNIFVELKEKVSDPIEEAEDEIKEFSFPIFLRFELILMLLQKRENEELEKNFQDIVSKLNCE